MLLLTPFTRRLVNRNARHSSILARFLGCARVRESGIRLRGTLGLTLRGPKVSFGVTFRPTSRSVVSMKLSSGLGPPIIPSLLASFLAPPSGAKLELRFARGGTSFSLPILLSRHASLFAAAVRLCARLILLPFGILGAHTCTSPISLFPIIAFPPVKRFARCYFTHSANRRSRLWEYLLLPPSQTLW